MIMIIIMIAIIIVAIIIIVINIKTCTTSEYTAVPLVQFKRPKEIKKKSDISKNSWLTCMPKSVLTQASDASQIAVRSWPPSRTKTTRPPASDISWRVRKPKPATENRNMVCSRNNTQQHTSPLTSKTPYLRPAVAIESVTMVTSVVCGCTVKNTAFPEPVIIS